jgi:two-component system, cell cycle response regulator DivK
VPDAGLFRTRYIPRQAAHRWPPGTSTGDAHAKAAEDLPALGCLMSSAGDRPYHILVIEDDAPRLLFTCTTLERAGHTVAGAPSAEDARPLLERRRPDLILMDLMLPGIDGVQFTRELREDPRTSRIPILALTGQAMPLYERLARDAGCDGFLLKVGSPGVLSAQISDFLEARPREPDQGSGGRRPVDQPDWLEPD